MSGGESGASTPESAVAPSGRLEPARLGPPWHSEERDLLSAGCEGRERLSGFRQGLLSLLSLNSNTAGGALEWRSEAAGLGDLVPLVFVGRFECMVRGFRSSTLSSWRVACSDLVASVDELEGQMEDSDRVESAWGSEDGEESDVMDAEFEEMATESDIVATEFEEMAEELEVPAGKVGCHEEGGNGGGRIRRNATAAPGLRGEPVITSWRTAGLMRANPSSPSRAEREDDRVPTLESAGHLGGSRGGEDENEPDEAKVARGEGGGGCEGRLSPTQLWPGPLRDPESGSRPCEEYASYETACRRCRTRPETSNVGVQTEEAHACARCLPFRCVCLEDTVLDTQSPAEEEQGPLWSPPWAARREVQVDPLDDPLPYHVLPSRQILVR